MINKQLLLFVLLLLTCLRGQGQSSMAAQIKYYLPGDGLSAKQVTAVAADGRGVLWIATSHGLNRFDGHAFSHWTTKEGLGSNNIRQLYIDAGRFLWLVYEDEKYVRRSGLPLEGVDIIEGKVVPIQQCLQA